MIPTWHEWNANANDIMMMLFCIICEPSDVTSGMCIKCGAFKYLSGLACMKDNSNLEKITTSHFGVLNTQNAYENMPNMIPIAYLNENLMDCNENLAWGK